MVERATSVRFDLSKPKYTVKFAGPFGPQAARASSRSARASSGFTQKVGPPRSASRYWSHIACARAQAAGRASLFSLIVVTTVS